VEAWGFADGTGRRLPYRSESASGRQGVRLAPGLGELLQPLATDQHASAASHSLTSSSSTRLVGFDLVADCELELAVVKRDGQARPVVALDDHFPDPPVAVRDDLPSHEIVERKFHNLEERTRPTR